MDGYRSRMKSRPVSLFENMVVGEVNKKNKVRCLVSGSAFISHLPLKASHAIIYLKRSLPARHNYMRVQPLPVSYPILDALP